MQDRVKQKERIYQRRKRRRRITKILGVRTKQGKMNRKWKSRQEKKNERRFLNPRRKTTKKKDESKTRERE